MPILVPSEELQPGMRLAEAFYHQDRMMFAADTVLTIEDIQALRARFPTHSFRVADPLLDSVIDFEDDAHEREVARTVQHKISHCMSEVNTRFSTRASLDGVSVSSIRDAVMDVIRYLENNPVSAALVDSFMGGEGYLSEHAGNVFYLSMLLGSAANNYVARERLRLSTAKGLDPKMLKSLVPLGLGAMLMDIGMMPLRDLFDDPGKLSPELWEAVRDHPVAGAEMLPEDFPAAARIVVRTHHENMDGTGYPDGIQGDRLHVFTRIVRIADAYDAATSDRVYAEAKSPGRVIWEMSAGPYRRCFDPTLISIFARLVQPFPIGSKIRLCNGRYAVVVKYNRTNPIEPIVIVAFDEYNRRLPNSELSEPIQLGKRPDLRAASFRGEDLAYLYRDPDDGTKRSRVGVWPSLFEAAYP